MTQPIKRVLVVCFGVLGDMVLLTTMIRRLNARFGLPVDLVIGLLSPTNADATHLHALAALSRMVRDEVMHRALIEASDTETLYALLTNASDRDAA